MPSRTNSSPDDAADLRPIPSKAEGEDSDQPESEPTGDNIRPVPSQAEGDEQTIDESLREKDERRRKE